MEMIRETQSDPDLDTVAAVIEALGGPRAVAALTGRSPQQVFNWRFAGTFAPTTFLVITKALEAKQLRAAPRLWRMDEPAVSAT